MAQNALLELRRYGQSVWYDFIRRSLITSGELQRLVEQDGVCGITSNPAIFEKAIAGSRDYDGDITRLSAGGLVSAQAIYERLAIDDIQRAADVLAPVHRATGGRDGYVSLEVSPHLADDTAATVAEARRLWATLARPNVLIKVPATPAGVPAIRQLLGEGINVNVTLLFARSMYEAVAEAYIAGLEDLAARGGDVARVASVASFFVSRIDTMVDAMVEKRLATTSDAAKRSELERLLGTVAIANAKLAYSSYRRIFAGKRWAALSGRGASTQRVLWASTSTKNPTYRPTIYVDELIGPETVNTVPEATLVQFREHGRVRESLTEGLDDARATMARLDAAGISIDQVTAQLVREGVKLFADAFDKLLAAIEGKRSSLEAAATA
jgi:transaldolase/glucose-6-phosphate isomerase